MTDLNIIAMMVLVVILCCCGGKESNIRLKTKCRHSSDKEQNEDSMTDFGDVFSKKRKKK